MCVVQEVDVVTGGSLRCFGDGEQPPTDVACSREACDNRVATVVLDHGVYVLTVWQYDTGKPKWRFLGQ